MKQGSLLSSEKKNQKDELYKEIGKRITKAMTDQDCSIQDLIDRCRELGYEINQSTISKIRQGVSSMSITNLIYICKVLSLDPNMLFALPGEGTILAEEPRTASSVKTIRQEKASSVFINSSSDQRLVPYLGEYWGYYFSAAKPRDKIENVRIRIEPDRDSGRTIVIMTYDTPLKRADGETIRRTYRGDFSLSEKAMTVYCNLCCEDTGKQFNFAFLHNRDVYEEKGFQSAVCAVLCTNRGENKIPTMQRMLLVNRELSEEELRILRPQLKLNEKKLLLSKVHLRDAIKDERIRDLLMERICDGDAEWIDRQSYTSYCEFDESFFRGKFVSERDEALVMTVMREYTQGLLYNKVGTKSSVPMNLILSEPLS